MTVGYVGAHIQLDRRGSMMRSRMKIALVVALLALASVIGAAPAAAAIWVCTMSVGVICVG